MPGGNIFDPTGTGFGAWSGYTGGHAGQQAGQPAPAVGQPGTSGSIYGPGGAFGAPGPAPTAAPTYSAPQQQTSANPWGTSGTMFGNSTFAPQVDQQQAEGFNYLSPQSQVSRSMMQYKFPDFFNTNGLFNIP